MRPERQFAQVGVELIGPDDVNADIEVVILAAEALRAAGISEPTIDINSPALVTNVLAGIELDTQATADLRASLDRKDSDATEDILRQHGVLFTDSAKALCAMIETVGPAEDVADVLKSIDLPAGAKDEVARLAAVVAGGAQCPAGSFYDPRPGRISRLRVPDRREFYGVCRRCAWRIGPRWSVYHRGG